MKEKFKIIFLVILFLLILVGIKLLLDNQNESFIQNQINNENSINNETKNNNVQSNVLEVDDENFESEVLKSDKTVLIDFYADWCGPCKVLSPIVEEVASENDDIKVVKINIDEAIIIANQYGIMSIPTLVVIKNGEEVNRTVGVISKTEIIDMVK